MQILLPRPERNGRLKHLPLDCDLWSRPVKVVSKPVCLKRGFGIKKCPKANDHRFDGTYKAIRPDMLAPIEN